MKIDPYNTKERYLSWSKEALEKGIETFEKDQVTSVEGKFIISRDLTFLKEAKRVIEYRRM